MYKICFALVAASLFLAAGDEKKKVSFSDAPEIIIILPEGRKDAIEVEGPTIIHIGGILIKVNAPKIKKDECTLF